MKGQADYYNLPSAAEVLAERLNAIADALPKTECLLDIGCNDGTIAKALLSLGKTDQVVGLDLEDMTAGGDSRISFIEADISTYELTRLPAASGVLALNILHHVIAGSLDRAVEIVDYLLEHYPFVIVDLGSKTEIGDWAWRAKYDTLFRDDLHLWNTLFKSATWRFKLLRYPAQGGHRVLWKIYKNKYQLLDYTIESELVRTIGSWSDDKRLIPARDRARIEVAPTVSYQILKSAQGDRFFRKLYSAEANKLLAQYEYEIGLLAQQALRGLDGFGVEERFRLRVANAAEVGPDNSVTFLYEPDLIAARPSHYQDWQIFLALEDARAAFIFACAMVEPDWAPPCQMLNLADFQCAASWDGLVLMDFEPSSILLELIRFRLKAERLSQNVGSAPTSKV